MAETEKIKISELPDAGALEEGLYTIVTKEDDGVLESVKIDVGKHLLDRIPSEVLSEADYEELETKENKLYFTYED